MEELYPDELDYTNMAMESLYDTVDDAYFADRDCRLIYSALKKRLRPIPFGDYLKRYIYLQAELTQPFHQVPLRDYQQIIKDSFYDNSTPPSFTPTTARLSALSKNWLTQQSVNRKVVFLLGFGLGMSVEHVNEFLTKALCEPEINSKDPFEVICWYCYVHRYSFPKYEQLWQAYQQMPPGPEGAGMVYGDYTVNVRTRMSALHDDRALMAYLCGLKTEENLSRFSLAARENLNRLYDEARDLVAELYNQERSEWSGQRPEQKHFTREDISGGDIERILCSAMPVDQHGNLAPAKGSDLHARFRGKRFSRQRIHEILTDPGEIDRFDLITLQFFLYSQKLKEYPNQKTRYISFIDSTNQILEQCSMGKLYLANPYESFVLMCILSEDPLGTYNDVWEMSYQGANSAGDDQQ